MSNDKRAIDASKTKRDRISFAKICDPVSSGPLSFAVSCGLWDTLQVYQRVQMASFPVLQGMLHPLCSIIAVRIARHSQRLIALSRHQDFKNLKWIHLGSTLFIVSLGFMVSLYGFEPNLDLQSGQPSRARLLSWLTLAQLWAAGKSNSTRLKTLLSRNRAAAPGAPSFKQIAEDLEVSIAMGVPQ